MRKLAFTLLFIAAACQATDTPTAPRAIAPAASRDVSPAAPASYSVTDVSQGPGSAYVVDDADDVLEDITLDGGSSERMWSESQGLQSIVAPDGIPLETDVIDARGDLAGYTYDGVTMTPWYRPAGGSFRKIDLPPYAYFYLQAMNDSGEVAGGYVTATNTSVGFVWSPVHGLVMKSSESAAGDVIIPTAMNNLREVVGWIQRGNTGHNDAFTWSVAAGLTASSYGATRASFVGVNDAGMRVLRIGDAPAHSELVDASGLMVPLPNPFGGQRTLAVQINQDGDVAGAADDPAQGDVIVPVVWSPDLTVQELPPLVAGKGGYATSINAAGDAAGAALGTDGTAHAALWKHTPTVAELERIVDSYVAKAGVAKALNAKLEAGAIEAFVNQVQAQRGKALTSAHAAVLLKLAARL